MSLTLSLVTLVFVCACDVALHHELSEPQADELTLALEEEGIAAQKRPDGNQQGWAVHVDRADRDRALRVMKDAGLPRRASQGFEALYPRAGLMPSAHEERVRLQTATAGELERSLRRMPGVIDVRVHLVLPEAPRLGFPPPALDPPRASVWVKARRDATLEEGAIRAMVTGAVSRMTAEAVQVVITPVAAAQASDAGAADALVRLGPWRVARGSASSLRLSLGALACIAVLALLGVVALGWRLRQHRHLAHLSRGSS